ncbi:polyprenol phosphomannose-dependent alpha 1,6 mannosyltransferase MptB [Plantactinospora mayteni]|uniref:Membrane protein n=1 Tax=Plantactinospora mayteni TaxID=566021 RepID=A0ABQ4EVD6_9ACTN|nr:polyprenol phosphomannose-dependent alpha 1,6 mannosyltransferase MptB [Plantactinospora mayteni]GIG98630.1 membrane protein [Plantactinospora mayteni]
MLRLPAVIGYRILGTAGTTILACSGLAAGALPVDQTGAELWLTDWRHHPGPALLCGYLGLTMLVAAWWWAGREIRRPDGAEVRSLVATLALWSGPLLLCPPLFSRDVYSYLAQGAMVLAGADVYEDGVSQLGGRLAAEVPEMWQHTPAPYGPVFLGLSALVAGAAGTKVAAGVIGLRLLALLGVGLLAVLLPRLARHSGVEPGAAVWLGVLNPLVPLHLVAGAHNEAVMLGLLVAGLCLGFERHFALATVVVTLAALVKAPAVAGLLVVVALARPHHGIRAATLRAAGLALLTAVAVSLVTGLGYGWIAALRTPIYKHSWSVSSALGRASDRLGQAAGFDLGAAPMQFWTWVGLLAALGGTAVVWWHRHRLGPTYALGLVLAAVAVLGPATRPWYLLWGLVLIAAAAPESPVRRLASLTAAAVAFLTLPSGFGPDSAQLLLATGGVLLGIVAIGCFRLGTSALSTALAGPTWNSRALEGTSR